MTETTDNLSYWERPAFHQALQTDVPTFQSDSDGITVAKLNDHFYKLVDGQLLGARVPADLQLPAEGAWALITETGWIATKARSMLGTQLSTPVTGE